MDTSFYTAVRGTISQQAHMNVIANNFANLNTNGYKKKVASFQDMMYYNMHAQENQANAPGRAGTGALLQRTETDFEPGTLLKTNGELDFAILEDGFFMIQDPRTGAISYTRDGSFIRSQRADGFYLATSDGLLVLGAQQTPIRFDGSELTEDPAIYTFANQSALLSVGNNRYETTAGSGQPALDINSRPMKNMLEVSNVDLAEEMAKVVESSRAYSYVLKMVQTADEVEQTINRLRD